MEHFLFMEAKEIRTQDQVVASKQLVARAPRPIRQDYRIIVRRNLFGADTQSQSGNTNIENTEQLAPTQLNLVLMGTVLSGGDGDHAFILDQQNKKQELYRTGDTVQGAQIKEILRRKVILHRDGQDEVLDMAEAEKVRASYAQTNNVTRPTAARYRRTPEQVSTRGIPRRNVTRRRIVRPTQRTLPRRTIAQ